MVGRASPMAQTVKNLPTMQEPWVRSLGWEDPLEKGMANRLDLGFEKDKSRRSSRILV